MKIYMAGRFKNKSLLQTQAHLLSLCGHEITSRWLIADGNSLRETAQMDLEDVYSADVLVLYADKPEEGERPMQGALVEFGFALALNKMVIVVDKDSFKTQGSIFFNLPQLNFVEGWEDLMAVLDLVDQIAQGT